MSTATLAPDAISYVCSTVRTRSAIELDASKAYLIEARLAPLARDHGFTSIGELIDGIRARRRPELEGRLVEAMTTNETSFFRDIHPFEALKASVLPALRERNAARRALSIWSAACSTGQEIYSVAILLREYFPDLIGWKTQLFGTDLSDEVLARAKAAKFSQIEINRGLSAPLLMKYFSREGMQWKLRPDVAAMASFSKLNLIETWPTLPTMDVVFLRNVLIYFSTDTKRAILEKVHRVMAPGAVLFLGAAETTIGLDTRFERIQHGASIYYRRSE